MARRRRQRGSIILWRGKRGNVWRIKYADATGRAVMETIGPEKMFTRRDVEAELRDRLYRVDNERYAKPKPLTFREWQATWFEQQDRLRRWKRATTVAYETVLGRLTDYFGSMDLAAIEPDDVAAYVDDLARPVDRGGKGLAAATVNRDIGILYDIMKIAKKQRLIHSNPVEDASRPRLPDPEWRTLEPDEVRRVAKAFTDQQARTVFLTLATTGLRRSELLGLRWRDVSLVERKLRVTKSKSRAGRRVIAIPPALYEELGQHFQRTPFKGDDELVFCHPQKGSPFSPSVWRTEFRAALKEAGIAEHVREFHDLRHTAITNWAATGLSPVVMMYQAGHSNMATTQLYIDLAGVVFADEAARAEQRMLGESSTPVYTDMSEPERTSDDLVPLNEPK